MSSKLWILLFLLALNSSALAQFYIGPKIGFTAYKSRFNFPEDEEFFDQKWKVGYQIGAGFDLPLENIFHFYTELYYSRKGKKTLIVESGLTNNAMYHFIEAPIMLRMSFEGGKAEAGRYNWHIDVGPTIRYWLGGSGTLQADGPKVTYKIVFGESDGSNTLGTTMFITEANRWQWGLNLGAGIEYPVIKQQSVFIDLRLGLGGTHLASANGQANLPVLGFADSMSVGFLEIILSATYVFEIDYRQTKKGKSTIKKRKQK